MPRYTAGQILLALNLVHEVLDWLLENFDIYISLSPCKYHILEAQFDNCDLCRICRALTHENSIPYANFTSSILSLSSPTYM